MTSDWMNIKESEYKLSKSYELCDSDYLRTIANCRPRHWPGESLLYAQKPPLVAVTLPYQCELTQNPLFPISNPNINNI